jgi:hypothetical protein
LWEGIEKKRRTKRLSKRERKEMRERMWEIEEGGGGDVVIPLLHHLYKDIRDKSRKIVGVCGYVVEREVGEEDD